MKRLLLFLIVFYGIIGNSWAVCELTESTDRTPSDEDLYPQNPNESRMALICQKGKCGNGEIVYMDVVPHYIGNVFNSEGFTTVKDKAYYKCKLGGNARWLEAQPSDIRTRASYREPTLERPMIEYDDNKGLFVYGTKASDGNYYTNLLYVEPDERCGVKCTPENEDKIVYCDGDLYRCAYLFPFRFSSYLPRTDCSYSDPETRISGAIESYDRSGYMYVVFGDRVLQNGDTFEDDGTFCRGCYEGGYFMGEDDDGFFECTNDKDMAWCYWRKNKENKNTEWKDDHCECLDSGMEWGTEQHDCVKSGKGGKTGTGSTGSGSGSGSTGGKKTCEELHPNGSAERLACCRAGNLTTWSGTETNGTCSCVDTTKQWQYTAGARTGQCVTKQFGSFPVEVCGIKCNKENENKIVYCDDDVFKCNAGVWNELKVYDTQKICASYRGVATPGIDLNRCKLKRPNTDDYLVCVRSFVSNSQFVDHGDFCWICPPGRYVDQRNWVCIDQEQKAWCYVLDENKTKWNEADQSCECLGVGMKWDKETHECVMDTGNTTPPQNTKIDCSFNLGATVKCRDGVRFSKNVSVSVLSATCDTYKSNVAKYVNEIAQLLCESRGGVGDVITNARLKTATDNLDKFFESTKSNPNVWKDADGKFNTARLASDATAGVVLGTVGGIVSAHVIKKKQLEKGFDALQCTIGKQKVADFGDEFTVGLRH